MAPSTIAPSTTAQQPSTTVPPTTSPPTTAPAPSTTTTLPTSPLASLVGEPRSVEAPAVVDVAAPLHIAIDSIGVSTDITPVGVTDDGQLEIPDEHHVGWYELGSAPGDAGATVLAAHVNWHRVDGPFLRLRELQPGARVVLTLADGTARTYEVVERQQYGKLMLPADRIWTRSGPETLVLITCGGSFNPQIRHYRDNIVAYAVPVAP